MEPSDEQILGATQRSITDERGWLLLQTEDTPQTQWTDINYAVWHIFDSNAPLLGNAPYWLNLAQQEAANEFPSVKLPG